jgi:pyruvate dehydrogenase E2 component (dihydrolipoamide acetyltransferase)
METGSIAAWNVQSGDTVAAGDVFCSIETDKAVVDFEAQDEGVVAKLLVPAGQEVPVNTPVMVLVADKALVPAFADFTLDAAAVAAPAEVAAPSPPAAAPTPAVAPSSAPTPSAPTGGPVFASPLARKLAQEKGLPIAQMKGTGPGGRIIAADVQEYQPVVTAAVTTTAAAVAAPTVAASAPAAAPMAGAGYTDYPISSAMTDTAARLMHSKRNVPHYYLTVEVSADALLQLRSSLKKDEISVYALLILAAGRAMRTVPVANAAWMDAHVRIYDHVDMNVVTDGGHSILISNVTGRGVSAIAEALHTPFAASAASGSLGTCTMINLGMYGVSSCAPIIREPQACAIALGALTQRMVPDTTNDKGYRTSTRFQVTASFDHRVVDGAVGAQWMAAFQQLVEQPSTLLL